MPSIRIERLSAMRRVLTIDVIEPVDGARRLPASNDLYAF
jgi:hypothetical protein